MKISEDISESVWDILKHILANETELFLNRNLD